MMDDGYRLPPCLPALLCAIAWLPGLVHAQDAPAIPRWEAALQVSDFPLYFGDVVNAAYSTAGITARLGYCPPIDDDGRFLAEIFYTHIPRYVDRQKPLVDIGGLALTYRFAAAGTPGIVPHLSLGAAAMRVDATPREATGFDCFECAPEFEDATMAALVPGAGVRIAGAAGLGVAADVRLHIPLGADPGADASGKPWPELALGIVYRIR